jgi:FMN phosphatase YigB (HAD superfamily)
MKGVIFDLDDTLIDFCTRKNKIIAACVEAMIDAGLDEDYKELHADFSTYYWKRIEDQKIFQKYLQHRYGKVDYVVLAHAILAYRKENAKLLKNLPWRDRTAREAAKRWVETSIVKRRAKTRSIYATLQPRP